MQRTWPQKSSHRYGIIKVKKDIPGSKSLTIKNRND